MRLPAGQTARPNQVGLDEPRRVAQQRKHRDVHRVPDLPAEVIVAEEPEDPVDHVQLRDKVFRRRDADEHVDQLDQLVNPKVKDTRAQRRQEARRLPAQAVDVVPDGVRALVLDKVLEDLDEVDAERADKLVLDGLGRGKDNKERDEDELHGSAVRGALL